MAIEADLLEFADAGDVDRILALVSIEDVADAWSRWTELPDEDLQVDDDPRWWACYLWLTSEWWDDECRVRDGLLALVDRASSPWVLECIGAGPLEAFVGEDESRVHWLERTLPSSPRLVQALKHAWFGGDVSERTFARIEAAAGTRLWNPLRDAIEGLAPYEP